jgi:hypothetical protein
MKPKLLPAPAPLPETDDEALDGMALRVKAVAEKLNNYIQANGCSGKLKRKAQRVVAKMNKA